MLISFFQKFGFFDYCLYILFIKIFTNEKQKENTKDHLRTYFTQHLFRWDILPSKSMSKWGEVQQELFEEKNCRYLSKSVIVITVIKFFLVSYNSTCSAMGGIFFTPV